MIRQTLALFLDAYRELNAKKLFWITLGISALVVGAVGSVGLNEKGMSVLFWTIESSTLNSKQMSPLTFYRFVFVEAAVPYWLTWAASILALVSTASIIPDFVSGGAIELSLSKPISRIRLILTKYVTGLTFAALQVAAFCLCCFIVIGFRAGTWDFSLFLAVPIVVLFFSYIYSFCALIGLLTRSTIAAILIAVGFWSLVTLIHFGERGILQGRLVNEMRQERLVAMIEGLQAQRQRSEEQAAAENREVDPSVLYVNDTAMTKRKGQLEETKDSGKVWTRVHSIFYIIKTITPKTSETVDLLDRALLTDKERDQFRGGNEEIALGGPTDDVKLSPKRIQARYESEVRSRSLGWVLGTSVAFELTMIGLLVWRFRRRDF